MLHLINLEKSPLSKKQRLSILRKVLRRYFICLIFPRYKEKFRVDTGLCDALDNVYNNFGDDVRRIIELKYPELYIQKPSSELMYDLAFWYKPGKLRPRIKCLRRAIKLLKHDIRRNNT